MINWLCCYIGLEEVLIFSTILGEEIQLCMDALLLRSCLHTGQTILILIPTDVSSVENMTIES